MAEVQEMLRHVIREDIEVESAPGRGSTLRVYLPHAAVVPPQDVPFRAAEADEPAPRGTETTLLVEDEKALRLVLAGTLGGAGYQVIQTSGPVEAVTRARSHQGRIHLFLTDVIMPEMNGLALAERIRSARPDASVLFMSGYTDDVLGSALDHTVHFIQKPFSPEVLLRRLRAVLAGEA